MRERPVLEKAHFVHAVSDSEASIIRQVAPNARIEVVPNAAYSQRTGETPPRFTPRAFGKGPVRFGYVGRYAIEHKGLDILLNGFARYRARGGTGELELLGTGSARTEVMALSRALKLSESVRIGGGAFGEEKAAAFARWDYFIQTSRFEGSPVGVLEAALAGLPLIVTAGTGLQDEVDRLGAGFTISEATPAKVADALSAAEAADHAQRERMARRAHEMVVQLGNWSAIAGSLMRLYRL
jgi:glycosyltransferase involved in cell wall biosynthesis